MYRLFYHVDICQIIDAIESNKLDKIFDNSYQNLQKILDSSTRRTKNESSHCVAIETIK